MEHIDRWFPRKKKGNISDSKLFQGVIQANIKQEIDPLENLDLPIGWFLEPSKLAPGEDISRIDTFIKEMQKKWSSGVREHGSTFKIDPLEEAKKECLDLALYSMITYYRLDNMQRRLQSK